MNKFLDQFQQTQNNILKSTIDLVTEKELWKKRTFKLAAKNQQCYLCLSRENWSPITLQCESCPKEVPHE